MTDIFLIPSGDKATNANFINESGLAINLWDSVNEIPNLDSVISTDVIPHISVLGGPKSATIEFFVDGRLKSRSNIFTITSNVLIDTNLDPYLITSTIKDENDLVVASGEKFTITELQLNNAISNIEQHILSSIPAQQANIQNLELLLDSFASLSTQIDLNLATPPHRDTRSQSTISETPQTILDFRINIDEAEALFNDVIDFGSFDNIVERSQKIIDGDYTIFSDIDALKDKNDSPADSLIAINDIQTIDIDHIQVVPFINEDQFNIVLALSAIAESLDLELLAELYYDGSCINIVIPETPLNQMGAKFGEPEQAIMDIFIAELGFDFMENFRGTACGTLVPNGFVIDITIDPDPNPPLIGGIADENPVDDPLAVLENWIQQRPIVLQKIRDLQDIWTAINQSTLNDDNFRVSVDALNDLVDDIQDFLIDLEYNSNSAALFELQPKHMDLTIAGTFNSSQNVESNARIFGFNTTIKDNIEESMREAGKCGDCDPVPVCNNASYFHALDSSGFDTTTQDAALDLNDSRLTYYGERLVREQTGVELELTTATVNLLNKTVSDPNVPPIDTNPVFDPFDSLPHLHTQAVFPNSTFGDCGGVTLDNTLLINESGICDLFVHNQIFPNFTEGSFYTDFLYPPNSGSVSNSTSYFDVVHILDHPLEENATAAARISRATGGFEDPVTGRPIVLPVTIHKFRPHFISLTSSAKANLWMKPMHRHDNSGGYSVNDGAGLFFRDAIAVFPQVDQPLSQARFGVVNNDGGFDSLPVSISGVVGDDVLFKNGDELTLTMSQIINIPVDPIYDDTQRGLRVITDYSVATESGGYIEATVTLNGGCLHNEMSTIVISFPAIVNTPSVFGVGGFGGWQAQNICLTNARSVGDLRTELVEFRPVNLNTVPGFTPLS